MRLVARFVLGVVVAILASTGLSLTSQSAVAAPSQVHAYTYDVSMVPVATTAGDDLARAPPAVSDPAARHRSVDPNSHGTVVRPDAGATAVFYSYDAKVQLVPVATVEETAQAAGREVPSLRAPGVAAKTERVLAKTDRIEQHLARPDFVHAPQNDAMLARIRSAASEGAPLSRGDRAFMRHELTENWLMNRGLGSGPAHRVAGLTHRTFGNYDPSVIKQFPQNFSPGWRNYWGIE